MTAVEGARKSARELALVTIRDVFGPESRGAQAAFDFRARRSGLDARDRAFAAELTYGAIKFRRLLDWYVAPYLASRAKPPPDAILEILRLGIYQLRLMNGVDAHAAVYETVNLARRHGHKGTAGLVNAILRRFIADDPPAPDPTGFGSEDDYLATAFSLPTWIVAQWGRVFGVRRGALLAGINQRPQQAIRVNALHASRDDVRAALATAGVTTRQSEFVAESLIVDGGLAGDDDAGRWAVQSEAAAMPVDLLAPEPGETVLELCSGRGNKTVQIAARIGDPGTLYAVELDARKVAVLNAILARDGVAGAAVVAGDGRTVEVPPADAVLLDAPCSGLGILGRHPEARWRKSPNDGARLAAEQSELLAAAGAHTRPGGRIVYSVCTTDPRETVDVVDAFLAGHADFARAAEVPARYAIFARERDVVVPPGLDGRDGFYIAALVRAA